MNAECDTTLVKVLFKRTATHQDILKNVICVTTGHCFEFSKEIVYRQI